MENKKSNLFRIIKSVAIAYVITLILIMIFAILLTYTNVPESFMETGVLIISMLSILISSFLSVKKIKENGLRNGALIGMSYVLVLYILSSIFITGFGLSGYSIITIILCGIIGMIGGIIGVNM